MRSPKNQYSSAVLSLSVTLAVGVSFGTAASAQDSTSPVLQALTVNTPIFDTLAGSAVVSVTVHITDDLSGIEVVRPLLEHQSVGSVWFNSCTMSSGNSLDGIWDCTYTLPQFSATGTRVGIIGPIF